jgi:hypothetical protein
LISPDEPETIVTQQSRIPFPRRKIDTIHADDGSRVTAGIIVGCFGQQFSDFLFPAIRR